MTTKQLNADIKKLYANIKKYKEANGSTYEYIDNVAKAEFKRLYYADIKFEYMNKQSILIMLRLNLRHVFFPLHSFGILINL